MAVLHAAAVVIVAGLCQFHWSGLADVDLSIPDETYFGMFKGVGRHRLCICTKFCKIGFVRIEVR